MSSDVGGHAAPPADGHRWSIPFWALQVLELGAAFLLVTQAVHVVHGGVLVAGGVVLAVLALTADGPLGVYRVCGRRLHRVLVIGFALALAACCLVPGVRPDVEGLLVIAFAVVALVVLATRTTVSGGGGRRGRRSAGGRGQVIDTTATVAPVGPAPEPAAPAVTDSAARKAGRTAAAAAAAGKRAVDDHRPQVEQQVKKTIRGAGRLTGRFAGPKSPPDAGRA